MITRLGVARFSVLALVLAVASCSAGPLAGSGDEERYVFDLDGFDSIEVGDTFDVFVDVVADEGFFVELTTDDNVVDQLRVDVLDGVLRIGVAHEVSRATLDAAIRMPELVAATASGSSTIDISGAFGPQQSYSATGDSEVLVQGLAGVVNVEATGGSLVEVFGEAQQLTVIASGGSEVESGLVGVGAVVIDVSGGSSLDLQSGAVVAGDLSGGSELSVPESAALQVEASGDSTVATK